MLSKKVCNHTKQSVCMSRLDKMLRLNIAVWCVLQGQKCHLLESTVILKGSLRVKSKENDFALLLSKTKTRAGTNDVVFSN